MLTKILPKRIDTRVLEIVSQECTENKVLHLSGEEIGPMYSDISLLKPSTLPSRILTRST